MFTLILIFTVYNEAPHIEHIQFEHEALCESARVKILTEVEDKRWTKGHQLIAKCVQTDFDS